MLLLLFTGKTDIQNFLIGTSTQRLRGLVPGRPGYQMMGHSRDDHGTLVMHVGHKSNSKNIFNLL